MLGVWDDYFWRNLISIFSWKTSILFPLAAVMVVLCFLFTRQNSMLPWFPDIFFLRAFCLPLMEADRPAGENVFPSYLHQYGCYLSIRGLIVLHKVVSSVWALDLIWLQTYSVGCSSVMLVIEYWKILVCLTCGGGLTVQELFVQLECVN